MTERVRRMIRMLDRQPPAVQDEVALRVLCELVKIEAAPSRDGEPLRQRVA